MKNNYKIILNIINFLFIIFIFMFVYFSASFDFDILNHSLSFNLDFTSTSLIVSFLTFLISFSITDYILNKFKYSENFFIRFIQRFIIYNLIIISVVFIFYNVLNLFNLHSIIFCDDNSSGDNNFNNNVKDVLKMTTQTDVKKVEYYKFEIKKTIFDNAIKTAGEFSKTVLDKHAPNLGICAAAGSSTSAALKNSVGMPPLQRLAFVGGSSLVTTTGIKADIKIGDKLSNNFEIEKMIQNSPYANPPIDRPHSPDPNFTFINSPLEDNVTSPLQELLLDTFFLDVVNCLLIIILLLIIFNRYIVKYNLNFINLIIINNKFVPNFIKTILNKTTNTNIDYNNKFMFFMFI